jgi:hypothetical protein
VNAFDDTLHRVLARYTGHVIASRTSSSLSPDTEITIGIATIKTQGRIIKLLDGRVERIHIGVRDNSSPNNI